MYQKFELYDQATRVPLIIRAPGGSSADLDLPVSHLDIVPTLAELMGAGALPDGDGISLAESVREGSDPADRPVFCEFCGCGDHNTDQRSVMQGTLKYIYNAGAEAELYDTEADPLELENLADREEYAGIVRDMRAALKAWAERCGDWVVL
jgi:arylsulfatase A-like enzyme